MYNFGLKMSQNGSDFGSDLSRSGGLSTALAGIFELSWGPKRDQNWAQKCDKIITNLMKFGRI